MAPSGSGRCSFLGCATGSSGRHQNKSSNGVPLTWPHVTADSLGNSVTVTSYEVWRSMKAYFAPDSGAPATIRLPDALPPFGSTVSTDDGGVLTGGISYY